MLREGDRAELNSNRLFNEWFDLGREEVLDEDFSLFWIFYAQ
jgi:hypothetical protein